MTETPDLVEKEDFITSSSVVTFMGSDGVGKSLISERLKEKLSQDYGSDRVVFVKGTNYKSWDISDEEKDRLKHFEEEMRAEHLRGGENRFYQYSAVMCYRYVRRLAASGKLIVIDSDPIFKHLMWQYIYQNDLHQEINKTNNRIHRIVGGFFPKNIIFIHPSGSINESAQQIWDSLNHRGLTEYDPQTVNDVKIRLDATLVLFNEMKQIQQRGIDLNLIDINKDFVPTSKLEDYSQQLVGNIAGKLNLK